MILCIGEILVDMIGIKNNQSLQFSRYAGGAPFNVACDLEKLGANVGFCGRVGKDLMGDFLLEYTANYDFSELALQQDSFHNTTLAFVAIDENGERNFSFHRKGTADYFIETKDLETLISKADIVHLGSLMLSEPEGRKAADEIIALIHKYNKKLSFDVNYREDIYESSEKALEIYSSYLSKADIVKFSEDEVALFTSSNNITALSNSLKQGALAFITLGSKGSVALFEGKAVRMHSIPINCIDTTGAGDGFFAGALSVLDKHTIYTEEVLLESLKVGNICGALITTNYGAIHDGLNKNTVKNLL